MSTVDVEKLLKSEDPHDLAHLWDLYRQRLVLAETLRETEGSSVPGDLIRRGAALEFLDRMNDEPVVSALDALHALRRIDELEKHARWRVILDAREQGVSWDEVADVAGVVSADASTGDSGADIRAWYAVRVAAEARSGRIDGPLTTRAYAALDDAETTESQSQPGGEPAAGDGPAGGQSAESVVDQPPDREAEA